MKINKISLFNNMGTNKIKSGILCKIQLGGSTITGEGFTTVGRRANGLGEIFEIIDLTSYPSCNDFKGESTLVSQDDIVVITKYVGRPLKVVENQRWDMYDVYEVLIQGRRRQVFRQNLAII